MFATIKRKTIPALVVLFAGLLTACSSGQTATPGAQGAATGAPTGVAGPGLVATPTGNATAMNELQNTPMRGNAGPEQPGEVSAQNQGQTGGAIAVPPTFTVAAAGGSQDTQTGGAAQGAGGTAQATGATAPATGGNASSNVAGQLDPCTLITSADVAEVVGITVQQPTRSTDEIGAPTCQYTDNSGGNTTSVGITVYAGPSQIQAVRQRLSEAQQAERVSGLGQEAVLVNNGLYVRMGNVYISVGVATPGQPARAGDAARELAQRALLRLPVIF